MKQRKKQPQQTRQAILDAAGQEFGIHGYAGTGLGAIVARAALTKGALFHHFPNKQTLAVAWASEPLTAEINDSWITSLADLVSLDDFRALCRSRCLALHPGDAISVLVSITAETAVSAPLLGDALERVFASWRTGITVLLERGKSDGWIHRSIQPSVEAAFLVSVFCGFSVTTRSGPDGSALRACATALDAYLETLRPQS